MKIIAIETNQGTLSVAEALEILAADKSLNSSFSQIVYGVYEDGRKTSLKGRRDGFYYMSGNVCSEAA
jgi:hypothetical protein